MPKRLASGSNSFRTSIFLVSSSVARILTPGNVAAGSRQTGGEPGVHYIVAGTNNRKRLGGGLHGAPRRFSKREDHRCAIAHKCLRERGKPIEVALGQAHVDANVLAIDQPILRERLTQLVEPRIAG